jgi:RarD protein
MRKSKGYLAASMLIFGSIGLFVKNIELSSVQIALMRGLIGCLFIFAASLIRKQKLSWKAIRPNLALLLCSGAAIGLNWILLFEAYRYTTISNATLSYYFAPVFVMFLAPLILKERLTPKKVLCIVGAVIGMFLIIGIGGGPGKNHLLGIAYGLFAAVFYASDILMNKFIKGLSGLETTIIQLGAASLVLLPYMLLKEKPELTQLDTKSLLLLLVVGVIHTGAAYLLYFSAIKKLNGQTIAVFCYIDPISAILMSSIFLSERLTIVQAFGGILILGATFFSEFDYRKFLKKDAQR